MESPIAIVGMSCRFAGIASPAALWEAVMLKRNLLTTPGSDAELPIGKHSVFNRRYPSRIGALGDLYACVPSMQHFPRQVNSGENQDLYFATQLAFDALVDAQIKPHSKHIRGTVRLGYAPPFNSSTVNWLQHTSFLEQTMDILRRFMIDAPEEYVEQVKTSLVESLPAPNASGFLLGTGYRFASWIARECGFDGAASVMDAGMLTGAATVIDAIDDLVAGRADISICGTITPPMSRAYLEGVSGEVPFSARNELHPFSRDQDGTLPGEGGAFFVLKRRADALRDHDRIYALVRSVAIGHAPENDSGAILAEAVGRAGVSMTSIGLIEADGSGIRAAEAREISGIQRMWGEHRPGGPLVGMGSIKGNIGHTFHAAMAAGMVKTALAISKRVLPPQVEVEHVADELGNIGSSVYLLTEARPWIVGDSSNPRRAAVTGANFDAVNPIGETATSGRSAAIVLEEEPEERE